MELTVDQSMAQMTIWSIWSAPLIMSNDLRLIAPVFKNILQNRRVIAIDQDPLGIMGQLVANVSFRTLVTDSSLSLQNNVREDG